MVFDSLAGFVLFSLSVAMLSLLGHTQLLPFDTELIDNMNRYELPWTGHSRPTLALPIKHCLDQRYSNLQSTTHTTLMMIQHHE